VTLAIEVSSNNIPTKSAARVAWIAIGLLAVLAGWFVASQLTLVTPGPYAHDNVERAIPASFPGLATGKLASAGAGDELAYRITYTIDEPPQAAAALLHSELGWTASAASTSDVVELLYRDAAGQIDYIARFSIDNDGPDASTVTAEFSPLPLRLAPARGS
jgi:hypothetical protein